MSRFSPIQSRVTDDAGSRPCGSLQSGMGSEPLVGTARPLAASNLMEPRRCSQRKRSGQAEKEEPLPMSRKNGISERVTRPS